MIIKVFVNWVGQGWTPWDSFLRGTEDAVRQFATVGVSLGHEVTVYHNGESHGEYKGAKYLSHENFDSRCDLLLIVKVAELLDTNLKAKRIIYYTNEIDDREKISLKRRYDKVEKIIALSNWHKDVLLYDLDKVQVIYHGIDQELYKNAEKVPYLCLYASSPDRGLQHLRRMWPEIQKAIPQARLEVAYNGKTDIQMDDLYRKAELFLYPCSGGELYCISGIKAQAAGCFPIVIPTMALSETIKYGYKTDLVNFITDTIKVMKDHDMVGREREKMQKNKWPTYLEFFNKVVERGII